MSIMRKKDENASRVKLFSAVFMTVFFLIALGLPKALAQETEPPPVPADLEAEVAKERTADTLKAALRVVQEREGVVLLAAPSNNSYTNGTKILFIRRRGPRLEPISQGQVIGEERNSKTNILMIKVQIDRDATRKYPQTGDRAVLLANEAAPVEPDPVANNDTPPLPAEEKSETNPLPGYLEYGMGLNLLGSIDSQTSSATANVAKKSSGYRFKNSHFAYYSGLFPVGIEMDSHSGDFPTSTYLNSIVTSSEAVSMTTLNYRFKPQFGHLAFRLRMALLSDDFKTSAVDGQLLSTQTSGTGFGARADYEFVSPAWKKAPNEFFIQLQSLQVEYTLFPSLTATDVGLSRGTSSSGSSGSYMGAQFTSLIWLDFVPLIKRWIIQGGYRVRSYNLKFSGPTVSEPSCLNCAIAADGTSIEKETDMRFFVGIRLDDPIEMLFSGKKKGDSKP
jgi:hypothetical protein